MPDLPTLTVTANQATRLLAAFGDTAGYKRWLRRSLVMEVERREVQAARTAANHTVQDAVADLRVMLSELQAEDPVSGD
jgi:hypothetical protein